MRLATKSLSGLPSFNLRDERCGVGHGWYFYREIAALRRHLGGGCEVGWHVDDGGRGFVWIVEARSMSW